MGLFDFLFGKKKPKTAGKAGAGGSASAANASGSAKAAKAPAAKKGRANIEKRFDMSGRTGQGSMSKVYRAYDRELGRHVCLKVLDKTKTKRFEDRFVGLKKPSEGEICMSLRHDNIVRTYEYGVSTKGEPYLVMEWVEGLGLNYLIETRSPQLRGNRVNYLGQLCDAVQYLHDNKWLHRDLCPRNVMVDKDGVVKLIDFGLTVPYTPQFCAEGNRTGTPDILAPEIIKRKATDHRVDLFALGVTAFEIFTGQLPWARSVSSEETFHRRLNTAPRIAKELDPELEEMLSKILARAIAREPSERYATATAFKEALSRLEKQDY